MEQCDTLIIGAGYAGLYSAHLISKLKGNKTIILERESDIGGRASNVQFGGATVVTGAGIGRYDKDVYLKRLMSDMDFPINAYIHNPAYAFEPLDVKTTFNHLKSEANQHNTKGRTFCQFAERILGKTDYRRFVQSTGYGDFEDEDAMSTIKLYGMDDNFCCENAKLFSVPWKALAERIVEKARLDVRINTEAIRIKYGHNIVVYTNRGYSITCNKLIIATTVSVLRKLLPSHTIYDSIQSQPFLRVYAKFTNDTKHIIAAYVKKYTVVNSELQKIIPINAEKGIYMIAYSDNKSATYLNDNVQTSIQFCRILERSLCIPSNSLKITKIKKLFWKEGTHYVKPLINTSRDEFIKLAQRPLPNVFVVGEAVCNDQGWVEGALKSCSALQNL